MGLFDFFKGKVKEDIEVERVSFGDIGKWLKGRGKNLSGDEQNTLVNIGVQLDEFYVSLGEKLEVLEGIDVESRKEHERVKILVRQGLDKYIDSVRTLLKDLKALRGDDLGKFAQEISRTFVLFEKKSARTYERATYLVGDEMMVVRNEIRRFYNGLVEMFKGDESSIKELRRIRNIEMKLDEVEKIGNNVEEVEGELGMNGSKIGKGRGRIVELMGEVEKIKNSSEYILNLKTEKEIGVLRDGLENEIVKLKDLVDFKKLTNIVHSNERELKIVKDYKDHFVSEFSRDGGKRLLGLLEGSNMKSGEIEAQVVLIKKKNAELEEKRKSVGLDSTIIKLGEVKRIEDEIDGMETEKVKIKRRLEEIDLNLKGLKNEVVKMVEGIGGVKVV